MLADELRKDAVESSRALAIAAMGTMCSRAELVWHNQQQVEAETRMLQQDTKMLAANAERWMDAVGALKQSFASLGDIETWARGIQSDMLFINASLEHMAASSAPNALLDDEYNMQQIDQGGPNLHQTHRQEL